MILPYLAIVLLLVVTVYSAILSFRTPASDDPIASSGESSGEISSDRPSLFFPRPARRLTRILAASTSLLIVIALIAMGALSVKRSAVKLPSHFLIPEGYTGWVKIEFGVQGAAPLPVQSGEIIIKIPPAGVLQTSSQEQFGPAHELYSYYSAQGLRPISTAAEPTLIWGKLKGEASGVAGHRSYEEFFVGSERQFKSQISPPQPSSQ
jgi:hypothetical protein